MVAQLGYRTEVDAVLNKAGIGHTAHYAAGGNIRRLALVETFDVSLVGAVENLEIHFGGFRKNASVHAHNASEV